MLGPQEPRLRRRRWIWVVAMLVGVSVFLGVAGRRDASETTRRLAQLRAEGLPTTPAELDRWYAAVPADENIAIPLLDAVTSLRLPANTDTNLPFVGHAATPPRGQALAEPVRSRMVALVADNRESLEGIHAALQRPRVRFPVNLSAGANTLLPHLPSLKRSAQALALEALLAADQGNSDRASRALLDGLRVGQTLRHDPVLISGLVGLACETMTTGAAEHVLSRGILSDSQLRELQSAFHRAATNQNFYASIVGEICMADQIRHMSASNAVAWFGASAGTSMSEVIGTARLWMYVAMGMNRRDYGVALAVLDDLRLNARRPFPERLRGAETISEATQRRLSANYLPLASGMIAGEASTAAKDARSTAILEAAAVACAVERFRLVHTNRLPESLDSIVPEFLPVIPPDPMDGQPLRYRPLTNGYVVYSIGEDNHDSDGIEFSRRQKGQRRSDWDYTFTVER
ncbi:MAG TPA: hypothetical protein DCE44_03990 [Verrucomicrobiales bacterium]|nr:hypothetical protein [Verrucomicrobiales bacterium]